MKKMIRLLCIICMTAIPLFAGDADFSSFDAGAVPDEEDAKASVLTINGTAEDALRFYVDDHEDSVVRNDPAMTLSLGYSLEKADFDAKMKLSQTILQDYPEDVLQEMTIRGYLGDFVVEGGKMKLVWGKGDKLHVLDNFNADDYTDFIIPDYLDRRIAVPMVHVAYNGLDSMRFEAVYVPYLVPDRYATSGKWTPGSYTSIKNTVSNAASQQAVTVYSNAYTQYYTQFLTAGMSATAAAVAAQGAAGATQTQYLSTVQSQSGLYANAKTLRYGQFGFRATGTVGSFDWGASYYYGHMKQPSLNQTRLTAWIANPSADADPALDYDRLQVFGLEGATAIDRFNFRAEAAYNLTDDPDGTDAYVHNNSIGWVFGVDFDVIGNFNVNVQTQGKYLLHKDDIKSNGTADVDYSNADHYSNDKLVLSLTDSFLHENLKAECDMVYGIELGDIALMPKLTYTITDGLDASLSGMYIWTKDDDSEFRAFKDNSFVQAKLVYSF